MKDFNEKKAGFISLLDEFYTVCFSAGSAFERGEDIEKQMEKIKKYQNEIMLCYTYAIQNNKEMK